MLKQFTTSVIVLKSLTADAEVLLIHHKKFDRWMIPGGHIEPTENPNEGAVREVLEETGVNANLISFIHKPLAVRDSEWLLPPEYFYQQLIPASKKEEQHYHLDLVYVGLAVEHQLVINASETNGVRWASFSEIDNLNLFDGTRTVLKDIHHKILTKEDICHEI